MPIITRRDKWNDDQPNICIGDLVLLIDSKMVRGVWPIGRITETVAGRDNVVRVVDVKTKDGIYRRPVHKLARLE